MNEKYRLLTRQDRIEVGDEGLADDCESWDPVLERHLCVGHKYEPGFHVPVRRKIEQS